MTTARPRAVIYARYSTDLQNPLSIDDQVALCRKVAERQGWDIVGVESDPAISGARSDRAGFQALKRRLPDKTFDIVLAESLDRISVSVR